CVPPARDRPAGLTPAHQSSPRSSLRPGAPAVGLPDPADGSAPGRVLVSDLPAYPAGGRIRREHPAPRPGACRADLRDGDGDWYAEIEIATEVAGAPILTDRIVDRIDCGDHVIVRMRFSAPECCRTRVSRWCSSDAATA